MFNTDLASMLSTGDLSVLFDQHWYRIQNAGAVSTETDPLAHYITYGAREGRDPHPLFDTSWYLERNPDVAEAGMNPLAHYIAYGAGEGRDPHPLFDTSWYLERNPDVAGADKNPLAHYIAYGAGEARNPHPLFDASWYFGKYPDVAAAQENPLSHYIHVGVHYGTEPHPFFNGAWYRRTHDLPTLAGIEPLIHFIDSGADADLDPSPYFSVSWYRSRYLSGHPKEANPLIHFVCEGRTSGYSPLPIGRLHRSRMWEENKNFLDDTADVERHLSAMIVRPHFYIFVNSEKSDCPAIISIQEQIYDNFTIIYDMRQLSLDEIHDTLSAKNYVIWLEPSDRLHRKALYRFASAINQYGDGDAFYGDEEIEAADGVSVIPFYKPRWSPSYLECFDYVGRSACYNAKLLLSYASRVGHSYAFNLQMMSQSSRIFHIRNNIIRNFDRRISSDPRTNDHKACLEEHFRNMGRIGRVRQHDARYNSFYFDPAMPDPKALSIVLYSAARAAIDEERAADAIRLLLEDLPKVDLEIIIIDEHLDGNETSIDKSNKKPLSENIIDIKFATRASISETAIVSRGEYILFSDIEGRPNSKDWFKHMFKHFLSSDVAAVGAESFCESSGAQYSGLILKNSMPRYVKTIPCDMQNEYFFASSAAKNYQAVSPGFMMVRAQTYHRVRKPNPALDVQYSLIDYCLRCVAVMDIIVHEPMVRIDYGETDRQRSLDASSAREAFYNTWATQNFFDPYYNDLFLSIDPPHHEGRFKLDRFGSLNLP